MARSYGSLWAPIPLYVASFVGLATAHAAAHAQPGETVEAVWKAQRVNFEYRGYSTLYTCASLERKLEAILANVGARGDIELRTYYCDEQIGAARFQIALSSAVEATPENVRALTAYDSKDELIATLKGERLPRAADLERFPAVWKTVSFARDRRMKLTAGDCELVRELRRQILPRMSIQIVRDDVRCSAAFGNIGPPRLTVSALLPANAKEGARGW